MTPENTTSKHLGRQQLCRGDLVIVRSGILPTRENEDRERAARYIEAETGARCLTVHFDEHGCAILRRADLERSGIAVREAACDSEPSPIVYPPEVRNAGCEPLHGAIRIAFFGGVALGVLIASLVGRFA